MLRRTGLMLLMSALVLVMAAPSAKANVVPPGAVRSPDIFDFTVPGGRTLTLLASTTGAFSGAIVNTPQGSYSERVYSDSANPFCSGCLDFLINISVSVGTVEKITAAAFTGYLTDLGFDSASAPGNVAPLTVSRSGDGATVGFDYAPPGLVSCTGAFSCGQLVPPNSTVTLVVATNSKAYTSSGALSIIDSGTATVAAFQPTQPNVQNVVEPASALLLGVSLLMGGVFRKKLFA